MFQGGISLGDFMTRSIPSPSAHSPNGQDALQKRIGWMCWLIRLASAGYAAWVLFLIVRQWSDSSLVVRQFGAWLRVDLSGIQSWQMLAGFALQLGIWALLAAACFSVWKLFSGYLAGRIFTLDAAILLRRIGLFGFAAQLADLITRPLLGVILSAHLPEGSRVLALSFNPNDLLIVLFLSGFVALAEIFRAACELAADHQQIV